MTWFILALIAPFFWAITNIVDDNLIRGVFKHPHFAVIIAGFIGGIFGLGLLFFVNTIPSLYIVVLCLLSSLFMSIAWFFYFSTLKFHPPSVVISLTNLAAVFTAFFAYIFLHERLTFYQLVGFSIIFVASFFVDNLSFKNFRINQSLVFMMLNALFYSLSNILDKYIYDEVEFLDGFTFILIGQFLSSIIFIFFSKKGRQIIEEFKILKKYLHVFIITEIIGLGGLYFYSLAISRGPVSLVSVVLGVQPLYVLLIAVILSPFSPKIFREAKEGMLGRKILIMLFMIVGLFLVNK